MATSVRARSLRWFAPLAVAGGIALIAAVPNLASAATPKLAPITPQDLIAKIQQADVKALSGTIALRTNLGIPNLGALSDAASGGRPRHGAGGFNPTDLLSGTHQALVWTNGPDQSRIALLQSMAEVDVVHNAHDVWTWDSSTKKVVHYILPAEQPDANANAIANANETAEPATPEPVQTPQQLAQKLLDHIGPSTATSVTSTQYVANQAVYQLVLTPKLAASTVDHVVISVDANKGLPLQVQVFAKGQKKAALQLGYSDIDYATPAAGNFSFSPPPGAVVTTKQPNHRATQEPDIPATEQATKTPDKQTVVGQDWGRVAILHGVTLPPQVNEYLKAATSVVGGKLIETPLVNVLVLDDGRVAVGAVNVKALQAAVARAP